MAKKPMGEKKKANRKVKRQIRRTSAIVLLITAIIVAAIPVPENAAASTGGNRAGDPSRTSDAYKYPDTPLASITVNDSGLPLNGVASGIKKAYTVVKSGNEYKYQWQFEYYVKNSEATGNQGMSIISKYNKTYSVKNLDMSDSVYTKYEVVSEEAYRKFLEERILKEGTDPNTHETTQGCDIYITGPEDNHTNTSAYNPSNYGNASSFFSNLDIIQKYFSSDYATYKDAYERYFDLGSNTWTGDGAAAYNTKYPSGELHVWSSAVPSDRWLEYYCDTSCPSDDVTQLLKGFRLQKVTDMVNVADPDNPIAVPAYIPQVMDGGTAPGTYDIDGQGFLCGEASPSIVAIADNAFKDVHNVESLILPENVKYIGDNAFENSFIQNLTAKGLVGIGNQAFKDCIYLASADASGENSSTLLKIGTEAFQNANVLAEFVVPRTVNEIGPGAFAGCTSLTNLRFAEGGHSDCAIDDYAFYNCRALSTVDFGSATEAISKIGKAAFAISSGSDSMSEFTFPRGADGTFGTAMGDYILAGRGNLQKVYFPAGPNWGSASSDAATLPAGTFANCYSLGYVEFSDQGGQYDYGYVSFPDNLFLEVTNPDMYVRGPQFNNSLDPALPRSSTWEAKSVAHKDDAGNPSNGIPYVYEKNGTLYYELCQDGMLMLIDEAGNLESCTFKPGTSDADKPLVAGTLKIPGKVGDTPLKTISTGSFDNDDIKEYVTKIVFPDDADGSQLTEIGDGVFKGCKKLSEIIIGDTINKIGKEAFAQCGTNIGASDIVEVEFHTPKAGYDGFTMGQDAFTTGGKPLEFIGDVVEGYAPFDYAMDPTTYAKVDTGLRVCYKSQCPENITVILDNTTLEPTLVDYPHYEEIDLKNADYIQKMEDYYTTFYGGEDYQSYREAWAAGTGEDGPWNRDYYTRPGNNHYSIIDLYENDYTETFKQLTPEGRAIVDSALNVVVPKGVTSIDAKAFYNDNYTDNGINITTYLSTPLSSATKSPSAKYTYSGPTDAVDVVPGLFSGYFQEDGSGETVVKGNDYIQSITLYDVKTLPDYAFDNCEALEAVSLGEALEDIGTAPFRGCTNLTSVGGNDKYVCENGIVYSKNTDNTYMIEECLPARGTLVGEAVINSTNDPLLKEVGYIQEGAFEECNDIVRVYLDDATKLATIPKRAFKKCEKLTEVTLPSSIKQIQDEAFAGDDRMNVTIYGKEVSITTDAFEHKPSVEIRTYEDSAALTYAKYYEMGWSIIGEKYRVLFLDWDGLQLDEQFVEEGGSAKELDPQPTRDGYTFTGWKGGNMDNIQQDTILIAQYTSNSGSGTGGSGTGGSGTGGSGSGSGSGSSSSSKDDDNDDDDDDDDDDDVHTVVVVNGMGSGRYKKGRTVTITANPAPEGKRFWMWTTESENVALGSAESSTTTFKMPDNRVTVTANYQDGSSGSSVTYSTTKSPSVVSGSSGGSGSGSVTGSGTGSSNGSGAGDATGGTTQTPKEKTNAEIMITKPGISDTDKASAKVNGSTDNFIVRITDDPTAAAQVETALINEYGSLDNIAYSAMDISLYDETGTVKLSDTSGLTVDVTMPIPDDLRQYAGNNQAAGVVDDHLDKLPVKFNEIDGVPCISFTATHFSPYTIYVETDNLTSATDVSPKTGDPIHPKWFLAIGLAALSLFLFLKKDEKVKIAV